MSYTRTEYQTATRKHTYTLTPTTANQVGYRVRYKIDGVDGEEFIYMASKNRHAAATLAVMQRHTNARVQGVTYANN
jgi:hypothetical protein